MGSELPFRVEGMGPDRLPWRSLTHSFLCSLDRHLWSTYSTPGPEQTGRWMPYRLQWGSRGATVNRERHYGVRGPRALMGLSLSCKGKEQ